MTVKEQYADVPRVYGLMELYGWGFPHPMEGVDLAAEMERDVQTLISAARSGMDGPHPIVERIAEKYSL